jgi:hypothetical protein
MKQAQRSDEQTVTDTPSESNSMKDTQAPNEQTATDIPPEVANIKDTDDINHMIEILSLGLKTNQAVNTDVNQAQLNPTVNKGINEDGFANAIINKITNQKTSTAQKWISTLPDNHILNNQ